MCERDMVPRWNEDTGSLVEHDIGQATRCKCHDGSLAKKRLYGGETQPFLGGWNHQCRHLGIQASELLLFQQGVPGQSMRYSQCICEPSGVFLVATDTDHDIEGGAAFHQREGPQEMLAAFLCVQLPHE